jgi:hypothetical protein
MESTKLNALKGQRMGCANTVSDGACLALRASVRWARNGRFSNVSPAARKAWTKGATTSFKVWDSIDGVRQRKTG